MNLDQIKEHLIQGDADRVKEIVKNSLAEGVLPKEILDNGLIAGMDEVGRQFKNNEIFIPEVLIAAEAMHQALAVLEPHLIKSGVKPRGKIVIGTVKGDLHDIGKNLVAMMLKGGGFQIIDCGIDVSPAKFAETIKKEDTEILAMSCLITTSMPSMGETIEELKRENLRDRVKIIVGGAPVTEGFARDIGADAYGSSAAEAVTLANQFLVDTGRVVG